MSHRNTLLLVAALGLLLPPTEAVAKNSKRFTYSFAQVWSSTVRFIRADQGYPIKDKDRETGYILFTFPGAGRVKACAGSLEVVPFVDDQGYHRVKVQLSIAHQPSYIEIHFLDKLERKLFEEQGRAPPARKAKKPNKDKDKNKDKGKAP